MSHICPPPDTISSIENGGPFGYGLLYIRRCEDGPDTYETIHVFNGSGGRFPVGNIVRTPDGGFGITVSN